jgi:cell fate regulator YaaT (PSP1 superfamily)
MSTSVDVIELKFKGERRALFGNPENILFKVGDYAIVEADKGVDMGRVNHISSLLKNKVDEDTELKRVVRKTNREDLQQYGENGEKELSALQVCKDKIKKHGLPMRLVDCEYQFDSNKITFHFTADNRVDFRELVRDVARVYKTRIEFRQIGVRDEARRLGGYGVCGLKLCCSCWIKDFQPVTTQVAKEQNLALNPTKLAGVCGRLKCCLIYERDFYNEAIKQFPDMAKPITTERGEGIVSNIDIFNEKVVVTYPDHITETYPLAYVKDRICQCQEEGHEAEAVCEDYEDENRN